MSKKFDNVIIVRLKKCITFYYTDSFVKPNMRDSNTLNINDFNCVNVQSLIRHVLHISNCKIKFKNINTKVETEVLVDSTKYDKKFKKVLHANNNQYLTVYSHIKTSNIVKTVNRSNIDFVWIPL